MNKVLCTLWFKKETETCNYTFRCPAVDKSRYFLFLTDFKTLLFLFAGPCIYICIIMSTKQSGVKLNAKWLLDSALLSRPVDLTSLVTMSRNQPDLILEDNTLHRLITVLLNEKNEKKSDKDTKLDVLNIMANVASGGKNLASDVRMALQGVSEWFDDYIAQEDSDSTQEPELHKAMVLLLARCYDYRLKTEDVLELTHGKRRIALTTVVGLLEDGETYTTELRQRQAPGQGQMAQWEHELICQRYERPLLLQICRLLRGFTHPVSLLSL
jgi:hypothetical protein